MNFMTPTRVTTAAAAAIAAAALFLSPSRALGNGGELTAVYAQAASDYVRAKLPDGSYRPETYTFGDGGRMAGAARDDSIDKLTFLDVAKVIAGPLERMKYVPEKNRDPDKTKLLIMVYWGTTNGTKDSTEAFAFESVQGVQTGEQAVAPAAENPSASSHSTGGKPIDEAKITRMAQEDEVTSGLGTVSIEETMRDESDMKTAMLLGYDTELNDMGGDDQAPTALRLHRQDLITEVEEDRYFVVLMAYDFDALWKHKKHKLLWVVRFSVRSRGTNFNEVLPAMVDQASEYFGQNSGGLLRRPLPEGHVDIGPVQSLGTVPTK
jgi:hypothetical protein